MSTPYLEIMQLLQSGRARLLINICNSQKPTHWICREKNRLESYGNKQRAYDSPTSTLQCPAHENAAEGKLGGELWLEVEARTLRFWHYRLVVKGTGIRPHCELRGTRRDLGRSWREGREGGKIGKRGKEEHASWNRVDTNLADVARTEDVVQSGDCLEVPDVCLVEVADELACASPSDSSGGALQGEHRTLHGCCGAGGVLGQGEEWVVAGGKKWETTSVDQPT
ncbi:hypothetical protein FB45DRAFT_861132 [Roridomyces roridus]|uniref:Uncharacterized protein n=1 Tax=Roridomyces roridus TaxID=1738132 RepID=A0AAD7CBX3_9AGAR|nr:hypothetical protein FB45DRAFT_861132 [Roridomyces roridus]